MGRMSDLDIVRQEHGLPVDTPLHVLLALEQGELAHTPPQLPSLVVDLSGDTERGEWLELIYDPDAGTVDRLEDLEM